MKRGNLQTTSPWNPVRLTVIRLAGALLSEQNDEWLVQRRYLSAESMQLILDAARFEEDSLEQQQKRKEVAELNAASEANINVDEREALHH